MSIENHDTPIIRLLDFMASDEGEKLNAAIVGLAVLFFPELAPLGLAPKTLQRLASMESIVLKSGLANGSLVVAEQGGIVPATNSHYDSTTGRFTTGPFSG